MAAAAAATGDSAKNLVLRDSEFELELVALSSPRSASPLGRIRFRMESTNYQTFQIAPSPSSLIATSGTYRRWGKEAGRARVVKQTYLTQGNISWNMSMWVRGGTIIYGI